jgi:predicted transcriptional regulator
MSGVPYYPDRPGYVATSDTSEDAADSLSDNSLSRLRRWVYEHIKGNPNGATCDEIEVALDMRHQTASARLRELFLGGLVYTTDECRLTRSRRRAHVYRIKTRAVTAHE